MAWFLVSSLVSLREEFNALAPNRDKASDGSIGDAAHSASTSDHNPDTDGGVHAIDVDADLRLPGWSMERAVQIIVGRHRRGEDHRLKYVIYNRRIWSASSGWIERDYTGKNPHDKHAHFSNKYTGAQERDTSAWGLLQEMVVEEMEIDAWVNSLAKAIDPEVADTDTDRNNRRALEKVVRYVKVIWNEAAEAAKKGAK